MSLLRGGAYTTGLCPTVDSYVLAVRRTGSAWCTVCGTEVEPFSREINGGNKTSDSREIGADQPQQRGER
ncbi:hypothetical protein C482_02416 [Natrialba chahannaoensis JCM 10990]|uniref:Uncharacterized protein n=1 Tax=Natrialba chahannaoensis JCM 10990 TaxID=1227492 RepID=M0B4B0_9EURY|nr:hypothetical protein [Natrialba chahannaoensis]ELZ05367.1 hypothetical protein C482_02416 [Natrialba chahannaoensis JCM 10990]